MTNIELAKAVAEKTKMTEEEALKFVKAFTETLSEYFAKGEKVVMSEFGSFEVNSENKLQFHPSAKLKQLVD